MTDRSDLDAHHRATVDKIFNHPVSHNIKWHDVLSLLQSIGSVAEHPGNRFAVTLGSETETFDVPQHADIDEQQVVDLRRMLKGAGLGPDPA